VLITRYTWRLCLGGLNARATVDEVEDDNDDDDDDDDDDGGDDKREDLLVALRLDMT
jgi:hypothetical protein